MAALTSPLPGEPLCLELVNTLRAGPGGTPRDRLTDLAGTRSWLDEVGWSELAATEEARGHLVQLRAALREHLADRASEPARAAIDEVLGWGRIRPALTAAGWDAVVEVAQPQQRAAWIAAVDYLDLLRTGADRIRSCAHPDCILWFHDVSPKGNRRWCSMAGCGNRAKAARHYARSRAEG